MSYSTTPKAPTRDLASPEARRILTSQHAWVDPPLAEKLASMPNISAVDAIDILSVLKHPQPEPVRM